LAKFKMVSRFEPAGDQPKAIQELTRSIKQGNRYQTLLGVTGSGKTYTMAKIIEQLQLPTLIMTHNKTLAAQLYSEFKHFFPSNHVEYFISYYDYYLPESYLPSQDLFIEKTSSINEDLERLRASTTASLLQYDDVIVIASVSANYGLGDPREYSKMVFKFDVGEEVQQQALFLRLVDMGYKRATSSLLEPGEFRVRGDVVDIFPSYFKEEAVRVEFFGDEIERVALIDPLTSKVKKELKSFTLYAINQFIVAQERLEKAINSIQKELKERLAYFKAQGKEIEYKRLKERTEFDLEMLKATGSCKGIENYARHLTGKKPNETPYSLLDYFELKEKPYLVIVDESHVSLPQFKGMYKGDRSRKEVLVEYGFRLPSALDNRPLKFEEFIDKAPYYLFVSATPGELELELSSTIASQIVRPTGLLDPKINLAPTKTQVETLYDEIQKEVKKGNRVLVTTLTQKMAEDLSEYYSSLGIKTAYLHAKISAVERNEIIRKLRLGKIEVLIGVNLLREGLDLPEVSLVAILDANKEGFLRSETSLIQTMGRAARHLEGKVILFCDEVEERMEITDLKELERLNLNNSLYNAIKTTLLRRKKQAEYNKKHNITPSPVSRPLEEELKETQEEDEVVLESYDIQEKIEQLTQQMHEAAQRLEFEKAAKLRDEIEELKKVFKPLKS